jgi:nucleoside 2-deoxyribosyltransferase
VILYIDDTRAYKEKLTCKASDILDTKGMFIEDFDFPLNLMFSDCEIVEGGFKEALLSL